MLIKRYSWSGSPWMHLTNKCRYSIMVLQLPCKQQIVGSSPAIGTRCMNSQVVRRQSAKLKSIGSNPISYSILPCSIVVVRPALTRNTWVQFPARLPNTSLAQWQSKRLLTERLWVQVPCGVPNKKQRRCGFNSHPGLLARRQLKVVEAPMPYISEQCNGSTAASKTAQSGFKSLFRCQMDQQLSGRALDC